MLFLYFVVLTYLKMRDQHEQFLVQTMLITLFSYTNVTGMFFYVRRVEDVMYQVCDTLIGSQLNDNIARNHSNITQSGTVVGFQEAEGRVKAHSCPTE